MENDIYNGELVDEELLQEAREKYQARTKKYRSINNFCRVTVAIASVMSLFTTASGIMEYVCPGNLSMGLGISLLIQVTLLTMSVLIPDYMIGANHTKTKWRYAAAGGMIVILICSMTLSSGFSYVAFSNFGYQSTFVWPAKARQSVMTRYRSALYSTQEFVDESLSKLEIERALAAYSEAISMQDTGESAAVKVSDFEENNMPKVEDAVYNEVNFVGFETYSSAGATKFRVVSETGKAHTEWVAEEDFYYKTMRNSYDVVRSLAENFNTVQAEEQINVINNAIEEIDAELTKREDIQAEITAKVDTNAKEDSARNKYNQSNQTAGENYCKNLTDVNQYKARLAKLDGYEKIRSGLIACRGALQTLSTSSGNAAINAIHTMQNELMAETPDEEAIQENKAIFVDYIKNVNGVMKDKDGNVVPSLEETNNKLNAYIKLLKCKINVDNLLEELSVSQSSINTMLRSNGISVAELTATDQKEDLQLDQEETTEETETENSDSKNTDASQNTDDSTASTETDASAASETGQKLKEETEVDWNGTNTDEQEEQDVYATNLSNADKTLSWELERNYWSTQINDLRNAITVLPGDIENLIQREEDDITLQEVREEISGEMDFLSTYFLDEMNPLDRAISYFNSKVLEDHIGAWVAAAIALAIDLSSIILNFIVECNRKSIKAIGKEVCQEYGLEDI